MRKLLVLGASEFQIPLLQQARKMGIHTCVLDINPNAHGAKYADEYRQCSLKDSETALQIAKEYRPDGVTVGMCDVAVCTCAIICEVLGLPGLSVDVAKIATDKHLMIRAFSEHNVPSPAFLYVPRDSFTREKISIPYPFISKPTDMAGSRGINLITCDAELDSAIQDSISSGDNGDLLIEEYMIGPEVSVEIFVEGNTPHVLQITDKITTGAPHFIEIGHSQPSQLSEACKLKISEVACRAVRALGLYNCVAHAEIIVTKEGPKMVEIGARMGGDGIQQQLIELSTGINLQEAVIRQAMGEKQETPITQISMGSAIRFIQAKPGIVQSISYECVPDDRVKKVHFFVKEGTVFNTVKDNSARFGYVIVQANTASEALDVCESVLQRISIIVNSIEE